MEFEGPEIIVFLWAHPRRKVGTVGGGLRLLLQRERDVQVWVSFHREGLCVHSAYFRGLFECDKTGERNLHLQVTT